MTKPNHGHPQYILALACRDQPGIVGAVGMFLTDHGCNIMESAQFGDRDSGWFMMRVLFEQLDKFCARTVLAAAFSSVAERFTMQWKLHDAGHRARVLILVSKLDHCLNDLLYRYKVGALKMDPVAIVSNHRDSYQLSASHNIPFFYLPVTPETKPQQEAQLTGLIESERPQLIVLARYMQILSEQMCSRLAGIAINIHHSFLPGFKGASPYHQAHARGVKVIGATAHYVTPDLDEGPIIEQEVVRVDDKMGPEDLVSLGRDVECLALARAVKHHLEHRVFLNGQRTVVFR